MMKKITLELLPTDCSNISECLRIRKPNGNEVSFIDPKNASDFLRLWFDYSDDQIKEYFNL